MKIEAHLDVDVVALEQNDEVTCLVTLEAPVLPEDVKRPGETVVVVVDHSGSMSGAPMEAVRTSLHSLVDRMRPQDSIGIVAFNSQASVHVPCRPIGDHDLGIVHRLIDQLDAYGGTDLSAGYLLGLTEASRHIGATGATVLLLSDGHANQGIVDAEQLGQVAAKAQADRVTSATIGLGAGYDETLLAVIAQSGQGAHRFAYTPDDAVGVLAEEAGDLLSKSVVNAFLRIKPIDPSWIVGIGLLHEIPRWNDVDEVGRPLIVVPLGDLYAGGRREVLVHFDVPAMAQLGAAHVADLVIDYIALPQLEAQTLSWPVAVNVVPGDEASQRIPDPTVVMARLLAEVTGAKQKASDALLSGDSVGAATIVEAQAQRLGQAMITFGADRADIKSRLSAEQAQLTKLAKGAREREAMTSRKSFLEDMNLDNRGIVDGERRTRARSKREF